MPSRASSLKLVTLQTDAATPCADSRMSAALIASPRIAPDAEQLHVARRLALRLAKAVHAAQHAVVRLGRQRRLGDVLVHRRHVVEDVLLLDQHLAHAAVEDDRELAGERRVVGLAVRHGRGDEMAGAVLVLQAFAGERRAAGGRADQEAARALVGGGPDQVADALEAEHRVVDVERQHRQAVRRIRRRGRRPRRDRARLGDAFLEDLAARCPRGTRASSPSPPAGRAGRRARRCRPVRKRLAMPKVRASSATIGTTRGAEHRVLEQVAEDAHEGHRRAHLLAVGVAARRPRSPRPAAPRSGAQSLRRTGSTPPSARRRLIRYLSSALSSAGL